MGFNFKDTTRATCSRPIGLSNDIKFKDNRCGDQDGSKVVLTSKLDSTWDKEKQLKNCELFCFVYHKGLFFRFKKLASSGVHECTCSTTICDGTASGNSV